MVTRRDARTRAGLVTVSVLALAGAVTVWTFGGSRRPDPKPTPVTTVENVRAGSPITEGAGR